jgi:hypothetical protein
MYWKDHNRNVEQRGVKHALLKLARHGYHAIENGRNGHADLTVDGKLSVEIKSATWTTAKGRKGRFQFRVYKAAGVFILCCLGPNNPCFIIPGHAIGDRRNVTIWSNPPSRYCGRWAKYLEAWHIIDKELSKCLPRQ